jgi:hypothetical protein
MVSCSGLNFTDLGDCGSAVVCVGSAFFSADDWKSLPLNF